MRCNYVLSNYPVSSRFRSGVEALIGDTPVYIDVTGLRQLPLRQIIGRLRRLKAETLFICLEDETSFAIAGPMAVLASLSDARHLEMVYPDLRRQEISRAAAVRALLGIARASWRIRRSAAACRLELRSLAVEPRFELEAPLSRRVLYLNGNLWFGVKAGGSVGHVAGVVNGLLNSGWDVDYATVGSREVIDGRAGGIALLPPAAYGIPYDFNYYHFSRNIAAQLLPYLREKLYAFLYQRMSVGNYAGVVLSREARIPLVLEYNGSEAWVAKNWGRQLTNGDMAIAAEDACLRHAHIVVTVSEVLRDELIQRNVAPERIVTYPNCVDTRMFDPSKFSIPAHRALRESFRLSIDDIVIAFLGTFGQWHGAEVLAQAISRLVADDREWLELNKVRFFFIGDGLRLPAVKQILAGEDCSNFCRFAGLVQQAKAPECLAASDIVVSPHVPNADGSRFFGSPTKMFEYMAMGRAIIASDLDQIGQVLKNSLRAASLPMAPPTDSDHHLAVLFHPGNVDELVRSIRFLVCNAQWRRTLGANARKEALSKYTWNNHVAAIQERIEALGVVQKPVPIGFQREISAGPNF